MSRIPSRRWLQPLLHSLIAAALYALPTIALAQSTAPPEPKVSRHYPPWIGYIFMFILLVAVLGVSLLPSKRAHQD